MDKLRPKLSPSLTRESSDSEREATDHNIYKVMRPSDVG